MIENRASVTARGVAAHRLGFERLPFPPGDAAADVRLATDVADGTPVDTEGPMNRYLRARTEFFDRAVVGAVEDGFTQIVLLGAGYDGRPFRYANPGTRWFSVDHPSTQRDLRERVERLALDAAHIEFVPADFAAGGVARAIVAHGFVPTRPTLFVCEGVIAYLERSVLTSLLEDTRRVAAPGSRFAASFSVWTSSVGTADTRTRFQAAVAAAGEPIRSELTAADAENVLSDTGWRPVWLSDAARAAGFALAEPSASPDRSSGAAPTSER